MKSVKILQYNILADGLAFDGFVCSNTLDTKNGETHSVKQFLQTLRSSISSNNVQHVIDLYDTPSNKDIYLKTLDLNNRWIKILKLVQDKDPDIIVFQEMDFYGIALKYLEHLGYISTSEENTDPYVELWKNKDNYVDNYVNLVKNQNYAFLPKLDSKARSFKIKRDNILSQDNDGCAIFWKKDLFGLKEIHVSQFKKYKSQKLDKDGALAVVLRDPKTQTDVVVVTSHLPSGQTRDRELERLEILDSEKGVFGLFLQDLIKKYSHVVVALDSNSDPIETYNDNSNNNNSNNDNNSNTNVWTEFHKIGFRSIWDSFYSSDKNTVEKRDNNYSRPITVNKIRGPLSDQPSKIGVHSHELIDHVFYKGFYFNEVDGFILEPKTFTDEEDALNNLIPNESEPSDHYPVLVNLSGYV